MNYVAEKQEVQSNTLAIGEAMPILWEWRKYRNVRFWDTMYRWGGVAVVLSVAPYLLPDVIARLGMAVLVFPALAALLSIFAAYLLVVEYALYKTLDRKYRSLLGSYSPGDMPGHGFYRLFRTAIGKVVAGAFLFFGIIIQALNAWILVSLVQNGLH